ncbi:hypothetical protein EV183_001945 [Coemansia sp. RSA 2336]|nr:hypothetical protein EV183_001945 [Coemansia sp. RSA 2336]
MSAAVSLAGPIDVPEDVIASGVLDKTVVFGYTYKSELGAIPWNSLTHLVLAFFNVEPSGDVSTNDANAQDLISTAHKNGVKVLGSIGGSGSGSQAMLTALTTNATRVHLAKSLVKLIKTLDLDGVDYDFEFPNNMQQVGHLHLGLQAMRAELDSNFDSKLLTMTLFSSKGQFGPDVATTDARPFSDIVDYGLLMSYDYFGGFSETSAPNSPFRDIPNHPGLSFTSSISAWIDAGWDPAKLVAGLPFYGRTAIVDVSSPPTSQFMTVTGNAPPGGPVDKIPGAWTWKDLRDPVNGALSSANTPREGWQRFWSAETATPWLLHNVSRTYIGYDDPESLTIKAYHIITTGLVGAMVWMVQYDFDDELGSVLSSYTAACSRVAKLTAESSSLSDLESQSSTWENYSADSETSDEESMPTPSSAHTVSWRIVKDVPWDSLTHANIAFAFASDTGNITFIGDVVNSTLTSEQNARQLISDGRAKGVKMLAAVGGQGNFSDHLAVALSAPSTRNTFISNAVQFVKDYKLDGIDIDWEYPKNLTEAQNLLAALQGTRKALDSNFGKGAKLLTITMYNHPFLGPGVPTVDYTPYADAVDYGMVMAYDYFGSWSDYSAPNAPFLDVPFYPGSFRNTTDAWLDAGWPAEKLIAGLAFYGHSSIVSTDMTTNTTNQYVRISNHTSLTGPVSEISGTWTWDDLRSSAGALSDPTTARSGWVRTWDRYTMTPWVFRKSDNLYIGYDDKESLSIKIDYSLRKGLAGVMIWEIGYDYQNELMSHVRDFITSLDDGEEPKNCVPSDSELEAVYDNSRDPGFFNRLLSTRANTAASASDSASRAGVDTSIPICYFGDIDEQSGTTHQRSTSMAGAALAAVAAALILL